MAAAPTSAAQEWRAHWVLVLCGFVGFSFFSLLGVGISMFIQPLSEEFGWSRSLVAGGTSVSSATTAILSPFVGALIDRLGVRRIALPGIVATACAISAFSLANGSPTQWLLLWLVFAVISMSIKITVWTTAVANRFSAAQGLALGLTLSGTAAAQTIMPPLSNWLIDAYGWRAAFVWLGAGWGGVTLLLCWLFLDDGRDDRTPALSRAAEVRAAVTAPAEGLSIAQAWRSLALWQIAISTLVMMVLTIGLMVHQIPILTEAGVSRSEAAWLASLAGIAGIFGKLVTGALLDRYRPNWVGGLTMAVTALAFALLVEGVRIPALIVVAMVVNGYSLGTKLQICSYLTVRYAGLRNYATIFGFMNSLISIGSGTGPLLAGLMYDWLGTYQVFLVVGAAAACFVACCWQPCPLILTGTPAIPTRRGRWSPDDRAHDLEFGRRVR
jgi:predicted MFS family arabinose efflux permease